MLKRLINFLSMETVLRLIFSSNVTVSDDGDITLNKPRVFGSILTVVLSPLVLVYPFPLEVCQQRRVVEGGVKVCVRHFCQSVVSIVHGQSQFLRPFHCVERPAGTEFDFRSVPAVMAPLCHRL